MAELAIILALTVVAPLAIILHFVTKWKQGREISGDDEKMLEDLYLLSPADGGPSRHPGENTRRRITGLEEKIL